MKKDKVERVGESLSTKNDNSIIKDKVERVGETLSEKNDNSIIKDKGHNKDDDDDDDDDDNDNNDQDENGMGGDDDVEDNQDMSSNDDDDDDDNNNNDDDNDDDNMLEHEEYEMLHNVKMLLEDDGDADYEEIKDAEGNADKDSMNTLQSLAKKGYIEMEDDGDVKGMTGEGMEALEMYKESMDKNGDDDDDDDNDDEGMNRDDKNNDSQGMGGNMGAEGDKNDQDQDDEDDSMNANMNDANEEGDEGEGLDDDEEMTNEGNGDDDEEEEAQQEMNDAEDKMDDEAKNQDDDDGDDDGTDLQEAKKHAAVTPTDKLEEYTENQMNPEELREVADEELGDRKEGKGGVQGDGYEDSNDEQKAKMEEFVDAHFDEHDKEDLEEYTKGLIKDSPAELKTLKEDYRTNYPMKNKGNSVTGKIDQEEFDEYVDEHLSNKPFKHLKDYAKGLMAKSPDAYKKMKTKYEAHSELS